MHYKIPQTFPPTNSRWEAVYHIRKRLQCVYEPFEWNVFMNPLNGGEDHRVVWLSALLKTTDPVGHNHLSPFTRFSLQTGRSRNSIMDSSGIEILVRALWDPVGSECEIKVSSVKILWTGPQPADANFICSQLPLMKSWKLLLPNGICT